MIKKRIAEGVAKIAMVMAKKACGAASIYGAYQAKEPKAVQDYFAKTK